MFERAAHRENPIYVSRASKRCCTKIFWMLQILLLSPPFDISMVGLVFWQTLHQSGFISPFLIDFIESERVSLARWFGCARLRARSWRKIKRKMLGTWGRESSVLWSISTSLNHSIIDVMTVINGEYSRSVGDEEGERPAECNVWENMSLTRLGVFIVCKSSFVYSRLRIMPIFCRTHKLSTEALHTWMQI